VRLDTGERRQVTSDGSGGYLIPRTTPGEYQLEVMKAGFRRATVETVRLSVNDAVTRDVVLEAGDVSETVTVTSVAANVQTRATNNTFTIDGVGNNNERSTGQPVGGGAASFAGPNLISNEAIQEFRVITSNADATFGRSSGAQVNVITRSGSNRFQGSAYEFFRDDARDARDFFNTGPFFNAQGASVVPPFRQHLFGASTGGPLKRDRHFFFASYEGFRQERQATSAFTFPNADLIGLIPGDLGRLYRTYYLNRGLVQSTIGPGEFRALTAADRSAAIAAGFEARLFDGDPANGEAGTLLQSTTIPQDVDQDAVLLRTDHAISAGWRVSARYASANPVQTGPQTGPATNQIDRLIARRAWRSAVGEAVGVLGVAHVVEVRGGWTGTRFSQLPPDGVGDLFRAIGVRDDLGAVVNSAGTGLSSVGLLGTSGFRDDQSIPSVSALCAWQRGRLTLRTGFDLTRFDIDIHNGAGRPSYNFNGFVGVDGLPLRCGASRRLIGSPRESRIRVPAAARMAREAEYARDSSRCSLRPGHPWGNSRLRRDSGAVPEPDRLPRTQSQPGRVPRLLPVGVTGAGRRRPRSGSRGCERAAEAAGFSVFLTGDKHLEHQQNLADRRRGVIVLAALSNALEDLIPLVPETLTAIACVQPGQVLRVPSAER